MGAAQDPGISSWIGGSGMLTVVAAIFVFGILVMAHELGHFIAAKLAGITVNEFSIGFGPKLFGRIRKDTLYSLRLLPLGGYVRLAGMDGEDRFAPGSFNSKSVSRRIGVTLAGPFMNIILAVILFIAVFTFMGIPTGSPDPVIGELVAGKPAAGSGITVGDKILAVNNEVVNNWEEMVQLIRKEGADGNPLRLTVLREQGTFDVEVKPEMNNGLPQIGIMPALAYRKVGVLTSIYLGFQQTLLLTHALLAGIIQMFTQGIGTDDLAGPVGITQMIGEAARDGVANLLYFTGVFSINLAILNLLPIPALDGSRVVFLTLEKLRGRPVEPEREAFIHLIGFALLITLMLVLTYKDILRVFG